MGKGKGKGKGSHNQAGKFPSWVWGLSLAGVIAAVGLYAAGGSRQEAGGVKKPAAGNGRGDATIADADANSTSTAKLPSYDELFRLSKENSWTPYDPYEKLELSILRFATIADASPTIVTKTAKRESLSDTRELAQALITEVVFVLEVMKHDTSRAFDLTDMLFAAVQSIHLSIYSTMKARLREAKEERDVTMMTKTAIEQVSAKGFLYNPLQELLKLAPMLDEKTQDGSSREFTRPYEHINVRLDKRGGALNLTILASAVVYRLYRLVPVLVGIGVSTEGALHAAIVNGDDVAVAMLLAVGGDDILKRDDDDDTSGMSPLALATSLGHTAIVNRLRIAKERWELSRDGASFGSHAHVGAREDEAVAGNNSYAPQVRGADLEEEEEEGWEGGGGLGGGGEGGVGTEEGGYRDTGLKVTGFLGSSQKTPRCLVDRLHATNLSAAALVSLYADRSRPVVIEGDAYISRVLRDAWAADKLAQRGQRRGVKLDFSTIPYGGSVFGLSQVSVGVGAYLDPDPDAAKRAAAAGEATGKPGVTRKLSTSPPSTSKPAQLGSQSMRSSSQAVERFLLLGGGANKTKTEQLSESGAKSAKKPQKNGAAGGLFGFFKGPPASKTASVAPPTKPPRLILDISDPEVVQQLLKELDAGGAPPLYFFGVGEALVSAERSQLLQPNPNPDDADGSSSSEAAAYLRSLIGALSPLAHHGGHVGAGALPTKRGPTFQFYLGSVLTGSPFHSHQWALNGLVHGRKAWLLLPPGRDVYSTVHPVLFSSSGGVRRNDWPYHSDEQGPCLLEQRAGEILFVPRHWSHSVLNLAETVGFAVEGS